MSKDLYQSLFQRDSNHEGTDELVAAFAQLGRLRKAAHDLASDEMHEGTWAIENDEEEAAGRYAADDRISATAIYSGGGYRVRVECIGEEWTVLQLDGTPGASLKLGESWIVLQPGQPISIPIREWPTELTLIDLTGMEIALSR